MQGNQLPDAQTITALHGPSKRHRRHDAAAGMQVVSAIIAGLASGFGTSNSQTKTFKGLDQATDRVTIPPIMTGTARASNITYKMPNFTVLRILAGSFAGGHTGALRPVIADFLYTHGQKMLTN